ncbi:MAG: LysM peptidoglycan-binding domain-containing protein [Opitutales bacterium]|nr:LysM peptidoglycan-binding domain-containing protein [Opitutales bacterium]NRA27821.1 LysM peptidoglycan-binding domain-containing protein [Opitutales bacterium]
MPASLFRLSTALCCLILWAGCSGIEHGPINETDEANYQRGKQMLDQGRPEEAMAAFMRVLDKRDVAPESHFEIGEIFLNTVKDPVQAIYHYNKFLEQAPTASIAPRVEDRRDTAKKLFLQQLEGPDVFNSSDRVDLLDLLDTFKHENKELKQELFNLRKQHTQLSQTIAELQGQPVATDAAQAASGQAAADFWAAPRPTSGVTAEPEPETPQAGGTYVVQSGDTLTRIAMKVYGSQSRYMDIYNANRDRLSNPSALRVGQELRLP